MKMRLDEELRGEYDRLFDTCEVHASCLAEIDRMAERILESRSRYETVGAFTGVPWHVVATIHCMECGLRFDRHLHNGDPLTGKTKKQPKGRPPGSPPFTWERSAQDALEYDRLNNWTDWSLAGTLYKLEDFNGWGYRNNGYGVRSPYLWSFSNHYSKGKYVRDRLFDPEAVSKQCGAAVLLKRLQERGAIEFAKLVPMASPLVEPSYPGRNVKCGERDSALVSVLQRRLNAAGCGPIDVDGDFGSETESAVRLLQARSVDSQGTPLVIDGIVGSLTWEALFGGKSLSKTTAKSLDDPLLARVIEIARSQVGVMEDPPGSNRGEKVEKYQKSVGINPGEPWCAAFVYWCFEQAATDLSIVNPLIKIGRVLDHWNRAHTEGIRRVTSCQAVEDPSLVLPGYIFIIDTGPAGGAGHAGLVEQVEGGMLTTIEGNTNEGGGRDGIGVFRRKKRKIVHINKGFIDYRKT